VKFAFVVIAVAIGVGSLAGVRGFSRSFYSMLTRESRTLIAADLSVRTFALPNDAQIASLDEFERRGIAHTWITETVSMAVASAGSTPLLVSVKAVEPGKYPFYGKVRLDPDRAFETVLNRETVAVSDDLLLRLRVKVGDSVRLGGQPFRIAAIVAEEPDRMAGSLNVGPRIMMTREALERAGLIQTGSRAAERFLFRIPSKTPIEEVRTSLKKVFPESLIADSREAHPLIAQGLSQATTFLSLVSLISLIVGALGVATAINAHLSQRMDTIAVMKCIGARSSQIIRIFVIQTLALGLVGGLLGLVLGMGVQLAFPFLISRYFPVHLGVSLDPVPALQALSIGVLATLLFTLPPLLNIRRIKPGLIFRREMAEVRPSWRERLRRSTASVLAGTAILLGIGAIAGALTSGSWRDALRLGEYFIGALAGSLLALSFIAWLLLRILRTLGRRIAGLPPVLRHGIANLYRPGNHAGAVLVSLGLGVMFTLTVYLIQHGLISDMFRAAPPGMPNVFLLDIAAKDHDSVFELLKKQPGAERPPEMMGTSAAKLMVVRNTKIEDMKLQGFARRFRFTRQVTSLKDKPPYAQIESGKWWSGSSPQPQVCVSDDAARTLKIGAGDELTFQMSGKTVVTRIACVTRIDSIHLAGRLEFIFSAGTLADLPVIYYGSIRMQPDRVAPLQVALYDRFPTVTVINVADVLRIVQEVVDQISIVIRFISAFAILAGLIILASSVAGTRFRRIREVVILKTLGATRLKVAGIFSMEFLILGLVAGIMGSVLATGFSSLVLQRLLKADYQLAIGPQLLAIAGTALIAIAAGWLASFRILGQKPLQVLREE
jgi:putative ABC transport system permease protein